MRFLPLLLLSLLTFGACTHTTSGTREDLDSSQMDMIREIRGKQRGPASANADVESGLANTRHLTARQYVAAHGGVSGTVQDYRVGGNDVLSILVHEENDLSRESVPVAADGSLTFPFIGRLQVGGKTPAQIEELIAGRLSSEGYLVNPHVSVKVVEYRSRNVVALGAVKNPGRYSLETQETLLDILSKAGGVDFSTGGSKATIMRTESAPDGSSHRVAITLNIKRLFSGEDQYANLPLQNDDVIFIPMAEKVYVMGEVEKPGEYVIEGSEASIIEAIGMAGGFTRIAAPNRTTIIRSDSGRDKIITVPVEDITSKGGRSDVDITLRDKDIIIVPESYF